jgi:RNA polymerase sigma-70 factor (ECF subfamily)
VWKQLVKNATIEQILADDRFVRRMAVQLMQDDATADDVTQEVYLKALAAGPDSGGSLRAWLRTLVRRLVADLRRGSARRARREALASKPESTGPESLLLEREEVRRRLIAAVMDLGPPRSTVVLLRYFEDAPPRVIAARLGMPVNTVRTHLKRSLASLRETLGAQSRSDGSTFLKALPLLVTGSRGLVTSTGVALMTLKTKLALVASCLVLATTVWVLARTVRDGEVGSATPIDRSSTASPPVTSASPPSGPVVAKRFQESSEEEAAKKARLDLDVFVEVVAAGNARVILYQDETVIGSGTTDDLGRVLLTGRDSAAQALIARASAFLVTRPVASAVGKQRIDLAKGTAISGRVEVDGRAAPQGLAISFFRESAEPLTVPKTVLAALGDWPFFRSTTDASGRFEFAGLQPGSDWRLAIDDLSYEMLEVTDGREKLVRVSAPASDLVIRLHRFRNVRGRVISGKTGAPLPRAHVHYPQPHEPGVTGWPAEECDAEGRFSVPIRLAPGSSELVLKFTRPERVGERVVRLAPVPEGDHDLGDVELAELRVLEYVVRDTDGIPIPGAFASLENSVVEASRTDDRGRGRITVGEGVDSFRIGALKHEIAEVKVPSVDQTGPVDITLTKNSGLEIQVVSTDGIIPSGLFVRVTASRLRAPNRFNTMDFILRKVGGSSYTRGRRFEDATRGRVESETFELDDRGRVILPGLLPDTKFSVEVVDRLESVLANAPVVTRPHSWESVTLEVSSLPRKIRGVVTDGAGNVVENASVILVTDKATLRPLAGFSVFTDTSGRFELPPVHSTRVDLAATKDGHVPAVLDRIEVPSGGADLTIPLRVGRELFVLVAFDDGLPVRRLEGHALEARAGDGPVLRAKEKSEGRYRFVVPDEKLDVKVQFNQWTFEKTHDFTTGGNELKFVVPAPGGVRVDWEAPGESPPFIVRLRSVSDPKLSIPARTRRGDEARGQVEFTEILPGEYAVMLEKFDGRSSRIVVGARAVRVTSREVATVMLKQ